MGLGWFGVACWGYDPISMISWIHIPLYRKLSRKDMTRHLYYLHVSSYGSHLRSMRIAGLRIISCIWDIILNVLVGIFPHLFHHCHCCFLAVIASIVILEKSVLSFPMFRLMLTAMSFHFIDFGGRHQILSQTPNSASTLSYAQSLKRDLISHSLRNWPTFGSH